MSEPIKQILAQREREMQGREQTQVEEQPTVDDRFFSILPIGGQTEDFFEIRFRNGTQTCFNYKDLAWFNYGKEEGLIDLGFGLFIVTVKGRGLIPRLFDAIKGKRLAWVREADTEMQDTPDFETYIESITITPPKSWDEEEEEG